MFGDYEKKKLEKGVILVIFFMFRDYEIKVRREIFLCLGIMK